ncbi:hypothetical protein [Clostridium beijerinckii]|nr:hypothetical protein [Clostridium beijerinckii]NRU52424.1 hypothetical protein [Clostridium beijerinckii]NYC69131.1 hypothetical protein [Clostridium beijerinckii]
MTKCEFQKEITRIILLALQVHNPFIRCRIVNAEINGLYNKLNNC